MIQKNYLHYLWIHYIFQMNFPLCLQIHSCSTLWHRLTPPLSPDIHFIVMFPYSSLTSVNNEKDNSYWEGKLVYEHYEKKLPGHEVLLPYRGVCRKEKWWAVTLSLFKGLQMKFSSLFSPLFSTFFLRARCFLQKKETCMSAQMICCMTVVLWQRVNGLISCLWIFPTVEVTVHTVSGWEK